MKKIFSLFLIFCIVFTLFIVPSSADSFELSVSKDLQTVNYNGKKFRFVFDNSAISYNVYTEYYDDFYLSPSQESKISEIYAYIEDEHNSYLELSINYKNGGYFTGCYVEDSFLDEYNSILEGNGDATFCEITYEPLFVDNNELISGDKISMTDFEISQNMYFDVYKGNKEGYFAIQKGIVLVETSTMDFYYFPEYSYGSEYSYDGYKISDESLIDELTAEYTQYNTGIDIFGNFDEISKFIFFFSVAFILGAIPFAILIIAVIKLVKSKGIYKKLWIATVSVTSFELVAFLILYINMLG